MLEFHFLISLSYHDTMHTSLTSSFFSLTREQRFSSHGKSLFIAIIKSYYQEHKRIFAWRDIDNPYFVYVSEVMLQQTQTTRVIEKFDQFTRAFPTLPSLAQASLAQVLFYWQGLGYNRRGKFLHQAARIMQEQYEGCVPQSPEELVMLPGIGQATASSIAAFAYNSPTVFIETNIRTVFIHFFFPEEEGVTDAALLPLVESTLDYTEPRQWYYALMDYGVMLKKVHGNASRRSKHYTKQSRFEGSTRQVRGAIIRLLTLYPLLNLTELYTALHEIEKIPAISFERFENIIEQLSDESFITSTDGRVSLTSL